MIAVLPFACEPGDERLARVFARMVERRIARRAAARFVPLAAERDGERFFVSRREVFEAGEAAEIARAIGAERVLDGRLARVAGALFYEARARLVEAGAGRVKREAEAAFAPGEVFDAAEALARGALGEAGMGGAAPVAAAEPVRDLEALALFLEAEEIEMVAHESTGAALEAARRRVDLLEEAGRRDVRIRAEIGA